MGLRNSQHRISYIYSKNPLCYEATIHMYSYIRPGMGLAQSLEYTTRQNGPSPNYLYGARVNIHTKKYT